MSRPAFRIETLVLGVSLVTLGSVWTLANLGHIDLLATLRTFWPLALVVWGILELADLAVRRFSRRS
jgi:hypothetical protein